MRAILAAAVLAAVPMGHVAVAQPPTVGTPSTVPVPTPERAAAYVDAASQSNLYEINAARLALSRAQADEVKQFAQRMIDEHTALQQSLRDAMAQAGVTATIPTAPNEKYGAMMDALQQRQGINFDRIYMSQLRTAHQEAMALHAHYAMNGDTPVLRIAAAQAWPRVHQHLEMLRNINP